MVIMFNKTRTNFWVDVTLFTLFGAIVLVGLGLWFILPGGQSGVELSLLGLTRRILKEIHAWTGVTILVGAVIHLALHWRWVTCMAQRFWVKTSSQARLNFGLDSLLFAVFSTTSLSGLVIWLVLFRGGYRGGRNPLHNAALFGLTRPDWLDLHRWAGLFMLLIVGIHLVLHWRWIICALRSYALVPRRNLTQICH
jgi:hypothetical protein